MQIRLNPSCRTLQITLFVIAFIVWQFPNPVLAQTTPISLNKRINASFIGDLNEIRERRVLRVLISYNRTNFFHTHKGDRGIEHDLLKAYEDYLNRGPRREKYKTHIVFLTRPFNELIADLRAGFGDIVAAGLTVTPERSMLVDFTDPYIKNVREILVANANAEPIQRLEDLSNKQVAVVSSSSYVIHLEQLNQALGRLGLPGMEIIQADSLLEGEDILELVNAGLYDYTVSDNHIAEIYTNIYPKLKIYDNFQIYRGGKIAWAINKDLPDLKASLNDFIENYARPGKLLGNSLYKKYFKNPYWIKAPLSLTALDENPCLQYYFEKYATFFDFDWHLIAAQAYQESRFEQNLRSRVGAYGIMQIRQSTASSKIVNIPNIKDLETNILAGTKYLAFLRDYYFSGDEYTPEERINFALAAYNAGPGRVRQFQRMARKKGIDPYKWFYNVEKMALETVGYETVNYVATIQKTKIAFKLAKQVSERKHLLKQEQLQTMESQGLEDDEKSDDIQQEEAVSEDDTP
ncbi:transglycosylase SLT domain-containing protein [Thiomicrorhabdus sp.]|uniref:transglycosylase SLT domain-containing protein n=1 Tax=Thiomicrorhabdus sp. TaxID=2039724 RepID=UPI0029C82F6F|nr:transporter substrate-binding domain-containing protein [Thiomicrorhabdus sp.]